MVENKIDDVESKEEKSVPAKPVKKSNATIVIIAVVLVIFLVIPAIGYGAFWWFVGRKIDKVTNDLNDGKVNLNLGGNEIGINTTENQKWPDTAPSIVPKYTDGKIMGAVRLGDVWSITVTDSSKSAFTTYRSLFVSQGWKMEEDVVLGEFTSFSGAKDGYKVNASYTKSETDDETILISIAKEESSAN